MPFDDPACFRLDRIPVRPIHWLWRPYLARGKLAVLAGGRAAAGEGASGRGASGGPLRPDAADEGKADRPPSRAVSALRPWPAANPKALTERAALRFRLGQHPFRP